MKKVIALALTLAMVLAMGVTAFAGTFAATISVGSTLEIDEKVIIKIDGITEDMKVKATDVNGFMTFGEVKPVVGESFFVVEATAAKLGVTKVVLTDKDGNTCTSEAITIKNPDVVDPNADATVAGADKVGMIGSVAIIDLFKETVTDADGNEVDVYYDGFSGAAYNAATKLHPETIVISGNGFAVTLYRGDYKTTSMKADAKVIINAEVKDKITDAKGKDLNNNVLAALGNNKADPFYVVVKSFNLEALADKPELKVTLDEYFTFDRWVLTNNSKAMAMYSFDAADDSIAVVAKSIKVNNSFDNVLTMPTVAAGTYVLVDATNAASSSANVKDNVSTGANDMMAVAVVFATIALAAGVSKKVR